MNEKWEQLLKAFGLMRRDEQIRVLETFATLRYADISERFFEAIHREIMRDDGIRIQVEARFGTQKAAGE